MANQITLENTKPGTPKATWDLSGPGSTNIEGFATNISVNRGLTVNFKINTNSTNYRIDIYRLGYYQGLGACLVSTQTKTTASVQPPPLGNPTIGLVDAGNWKISASWLIPATAVSGVYIAHLVRLDATKGENHIPFIVRDDGTPHDIVFQTSDTTWHAYNGWGGYSLYGGSTSATDGRAYKVSYNRPIATRDGIGTFAGPQDFLFGVEVAAIHWLEANGYDVCYIAGVDTERLDPTGKGAQFIARHKVFLSVGHDEYWSKVQRANVEAARSAGVHLAFWSGNEVFWKTRYESSTVTTDGSPATYRTLVCYKETRDNKKIDPLDPPICTSSWRDARFGPPGDAGRPENALTGTLFMVDDFRQDQILIPYPMTKLRFWRNTKIATVQPGQIGSLVKNYLGYEWDESPDNGFRPAGLIRLSLTTLPVDTYLLDYGHNEGPGIATHSLTMYKDPVKGAIVFGAGTVMWTWGLDPNHDPDPNNLTPTPTDINVKQAMVNLLADMGVLAQNLQTGLVPATASTDKTAPISKISFPASGASFPQYQTVAITGTATDIGGQVAGVEVSTDGGTSWHPASSTSFNSATAVTSWTYNWLPQSPGTFTIRARSVDDSLNLETAGPGFSVTVTAATGVTLFGGATPKLLSTNDPNAVELGVKFQSSQAGTITALRFYKGTQNIGTHTAHLWNAAGTLLASATFSGETSSGWQQVFFSSPVPIIANTLYVASYHTAGNYSTDSDYFDAAHSNGPLTAPASDTIGGNGLYSYGASGLLPTNSFLGTNYWVDVVFKPGGTGAPQPPVAKNDSGLTTTANKALVIAAATLLANDTDPASLVLSVTGVSSPTHGTVSFNSTNKTVTFTPTSGYTGPASFVYAIKNTANLTASATVSLVVNTLGGTTSSLFASTSAPATITVNDPSAVELGVKFQSSVAGKITGLRFYKGPQNTGTHTAHLWSAAGTLLATAAFAGETASGWQQVNFATAVAISANTVYVASYFTATGFYSADANYFASSHVSGTLTAPATANGVYVYGTTSKFPINSFGASNYWVDVVFMST